MSMDITVNGSRTTLSGGATVGALLDHLGLRRDGIAVARNRRVVPRSRHDTECLEAGDRVEIIQAVGGG